jgi:hypothetical protein
MEASDHPTPPSFYREREMLDNSLNLCGYGSEEKYPCLCWQCAEPLLCDDREVSKYTRPPFLGNCSVNAFPQQRIDAQQYRYCWKRRVFYMVRAEGLSWRKLGRPSQFCTGVCEYRIRAREAGESALLEVVAREQLVKTSRLKKTWCVVNCKLWNLVMVL